MSKTTACGCLAVVIAIYNKCGYIGITYRDEEHRQGYDIPMHE